MSQSYENLRGADGRERYFRPLRHKASELFSGAPPRLVFDDEEFKLEDISVKGAGCFNRAAESDEEISSRGATGILRLTQHGRDIFRAVARKARVAPAQDGIFAGFELTDGQFDLPSLAQKNAYLLALHTGERSDPEPSVDYKGFCADVAAFIGEYLKRIDKYIAPLEAGLPDAERDKIATDLAESAKPEWIKLLRRGNALIAPYHGDKASRTGLKSFTETMITPLLLDGPGWERSYIKPMGYPGDFRIMNYIYDGSPAGETVKAKFLHLLSLIGSFAIKTRMDRISELIAADANASGRSEFNFLSIGCGPARELVQIDKAVNPGVQLNATLVDQETEALEYAVNDACIRYAEDRVKTTALNISFKEMLDPSPMSSLYLDQDIIYSVGLVDYLSPLLAQRFVSKIYQYLKPGGKLIIANLNDCETGMIWPCEYITDWRLYFRNHDDMVQMARSLDDANVSVVSDSLEAVYFLIVEKPLQAS